MGTMIIAVLIFGATLVRYYEPRHPTRHLCGIGYESLELGCSLAHKGTFSDPFRLLDTGPSAHVAPAFPAAMAAIMRIFGDQADGSYAVQWAGALVLALQLSFWPFLSRRLGMGFTAGVLGAIAFLFAGIVLLPMWEAFYVGLFIVTLSYLTHRMLTGAPSWSLIVVSGLLLGITLLLNPVPIFAFIAILIWICFSNKVSKVKTLSLAAIPLLVIGPWLIRDYKVLGHFIFIRDNLGLELAVSNNSCAPFWFWKNFHADCFRNLHPDESLAEAEKVRDLGEYGYNQARLRESLVWMRQNPGPFLKVSGQRFIAFWFPTPTGNPFSDQHVSAQMLMLWALALLSIPGLWVLWRSDRNAAGIMLIWLVLFPPIYYFIQYDVRYRYPILWATFLPGCFFLAELSKGVWHAFRRN
jgi:hypothetical protein